MKSLTTRDLDRILNSNPVTGRYFLGTFPSCMSPRTNLKKYSFLSNTENHEYGGEHWCGWMVNEDKITFFDSFGRHPSDPTFPADFMDNVNKKT